MNGLAKITKKIQLAAEQIVEQEQKHLCSLVVKFARENKIPFYKVGVKIIAPYREFLPNKILDKNYTYTPPKYELYVLSDEEITKLAIMESEAKRLQIETKNFVDKTFKYLTE